MITILQAVALVAAFSAVFLALGWHERGRHERAQRRQRREFHVRQWIERL